MPAWGAGRRPPPIDGGWGSPVATMSRSSSSSGADDRFEAIVRPDASRPVALMPGVELRPMADAHRGARGLFAGLLTLEPGAAIPYYARSTSEAMVVLEGAAAVEVEGRRYDLGPLDAIAVAPRRPRRLANTSDDRPAVLHVAMASGEPEQSWVNGRFDPAEQPIASTGREGSERIVRWPVAPVAELAPRALFRDLYNVELGTRGLCGGYGLFEPGARLPCHRHPFDESITIVQGTATCIVEGRRHELSGLATAMVPQGRCHYFINLTLEPMAMIWVYAGDRPDRIIVDELLCHPEKARGPK
jgi:quercetin dioxygenase-like cupin family protein